MDIKNLEIRTVNIIRYVQPFREGGSLPALVDADDDFSYVIKFRGAGQGRKALIAELIGGELARYLGLRIPEIVYAMLDESFGRTEPDEEIQDLLKFSVGKNLGLHFLNGAITFDANVDQIEATEASKILWLDAFLMNVDRTVRNTNMLIWHKELWLIDHGAALYFHHSWDNWLEQSEKPFVQIKDHVLLKNASEVAAVDALFRPTLNKEVFQAIVNLIPDEWLIDEERSLSADDAREVYVSFLCNRLAHADTFLNQIEHARKNLI